MRLGKSLFNASGELLLSEGKELIPPYIDRLRQLRINGVYIDDSISEDIEIQNVVSDEVRNKAVQGVRNIMTHAISDNPADKTAAIVKAKEIVEALMEEIQKNSDLMVNMVDLKVFDEYTYYHSVNVAILSTVVGVAIGMNRKDLFALGLASLLHDLGKVFIEKEIISKPGRLSEDEFSDIKRHSELGYTYLRSMFEVPVKASMGVLHHHERYDGSGYPKGLSGEEISLFGRIIAVADVFDALVSDRPYRKALLPSDAMEHIMGNGGVIFDPNIARIFAMKIAPYPLGTAVELSNGNVGLVVENYEGFGLRPAIKIITEKGKSVTPYVINLLTDSKCLNITITGISGMSEEKTTENAG
jgi:HD-GYP domain-containing protein (c-di-GMP phosphodiesterase class II)